MQTVSNVCFRFNKKPLIYIGLLGICVVLGMCYPDYRYMHAKVFMLMRIRVFKGLTITQTQIYRVFRRLHVLQCIFCIS